MMAINAEATSNGSPLANRHAHDADLEAKQPLLLPTAVKRRVEQPRFAKLTLPPKYDNLSLVTRLWLQSRLVEPSEDKKDKKKEKEKEKGSGDDEKDKEQEGGEKSVAIATPDEPVFRTGGRKRPITPAALWVWLDLARVLAPYLRVALQHARPLRLAIYILKMVLDTLQPTFKIYAQSQLYDLVEEALAGKPAPWPTALRIGSAGLMIRLADDLLSTFFSSNGQALHEWIEHGLEKAYLKMQLDQPLHATDDVEAAQVFEAGVFAGLESAENYNDGPWGLINGLGGAFAKCVDIATRLTMVLNALGGVGQLKNLRDGRKGTQTALLITLAFAPTVLQQLREKAYSAYYASNRYKAYAEGPDAEQELETMQDLATSGQHKQELVLFGLRDWVLDRWEAARNLAQKQREERPAEGQWLNQAFGSAEEVLRTIFYVLLATKTIDTGLTLGSIHLYQNTATSLMWSFRSLKRNCDSAWQSMYYAAAFVGACDPVPRGPMIDYETVRVPGGMRIEARNLSFTYSGAPEPTLHGINLVVERGETLAIVGYNGGGKTTLVKVLMGLYVPDDNGGQLLFNGIPAADFDSATVHKRQSALFQDFARYEFTLKDNVAIGDVSQLHDEAAINAAIEAGGAQAVREKVGLDGVLNPYGEPKTYKSKAVNWYQEYGSDSDGDEDEDEDDEGENLSEDDDKEKEKNDTSVEPSAGDNAAEATETADGAVTPVDKVPGTPNPDAPNPDAPSTPGSPGSSTSEAAAGTSTPKTKKKKQGGSTALSGGQWQRVGLARAFMRAGHADLVVFDEPSAALDPRAEAELFANIHGLSRAAGATTIYISHRFNTVRKADKIALVENGTIAEYGSHAELMALKGQYYDLFTTQAEGYLG